MKLATIRTGQGHAVVRVDGHEAVEVAVGDVGALLAQEGWSDRAASADGKRYSTTSLSYAPLVTNPQKIMCVGLNYSRHIAELGQEPPEYPTLFAKFASSLIGAYDDIVLPHVTTKVDWEAELGIVIGAPTRYVGATEAIDAIAGYCVVNDISMRDWQRRTSEWLQGKAFEASTPVGPWLVTPDEVVDAADLRVRCEVDGTVMQDSSTAEMIFRPAEIVAYVSQFTTLQPGDLIATGTPAGVGDGRDPQIFLAPGQEVMAAVEGLGECRNRCVGEEEPRVSVAEPVPRGDQWRNE